jgi:expansin (peptidoglycan-binding protein)
MRRSAALPLVLVALASALSCSDPEGPDFENRNARGADDDGGASSSTSSSSGGGSSSGNGSSGGNTATDVSTSKDTGATPLPDGGSTVEYSGEATYYDANGTGACGFPANPSEVNVAAMNKAQYSKAVCGRCALVTGPNGTVKVRIIDLCPGCSMGDVDLNRDAFKAIAPLSAGRVKIKWRFVTC